MPNNKVFIIVAAMIGLLALGLGLGVYSARYYEGASAPVVEGILWPNPKQLNPFAVIDQSGQAFGLDQMRGKWSFLFFGYTHCPDVCPVTLSVLNQVQTKFNQKQKSDQLQTIFVTIDPQRDTARQLADYVSYFNPAFIGLSGSLEQVQSLSGQIGVVSMRGEEFADGNYLMDHSASVFLIDPNGRLISILSAPHQPESILSRFEQIKDFVKNNTKDY